MVVVDESPEVEGALFYAAGRVLHAGGSVLLLYVIEPDNQFWEGVRQVQLEEIVKQIDEDEDVAVLVLGASKEAAGPGPLVSGLAAGAMAGKFPIPITIVPGDLAVEDIKALA